MKHIRFTIQFIVLLAAIPIFMFAELTRSNKETVVNGKMQFEVRSNNSSVVGVEIMPTSHTLLN